MVLAFGDGFTGSAPNAKELCVEVRRRDGVRVAVVFVGTESAPSAERAHRGLVACFAVRISGGRHSWPFVGWCVGYAITARNVAQPPS